MQAAISTGILVGFTWTTAGCQPKAAAPFILPVSATKIQTRSFEKSIQAEGTLLSDNYIQIKPQTSGLISKVFVKPSDIFAKLLAAIPAKIPTAKNKYPNKGFKINLLMQFY